MKTYEEIKTKIVENKENLILGVCFVLVFLVGFGTGRYEKQIQRPNYKPQTNYTTQISKKTAPGEQPTTGQVLGQGTVAPQVVDAKNCIVKGNISAAGKKVFHVQGGAFYKIVKPEQCFNTEGEAISAGFIKSSR